MLILKIIYVPWCHLLFIIVLVGLKSTSIIQEFFIMAFLLYFDLTFNKLRFVLRLSKAVLCRMLSPTHYNVFITKRGSDGLLMLVYII